MRVLSQLIEYLVISIIVIIVFKPFGCHAISVDQPAPLCILKNTTAQLHDLSLLRNDTLTVLYFRNAEAHSNPEFLNGMGALCSQFLEAKFNLWGICNNSESTVAWWVRKHEIQVPVLVDDGRVRWLLVIFISSGPSSRTSCWSLHKLLRQHISCRVDFQLPQNVNVWSIEIVSWLDL